MKKLYKSMLAVAALASAMSASAATSWMTSTFQFDNWWTEMTSATIVDINNDGANDVIYMNHDGGRVYLNNVDNPGFEFSRVDNLFGLSHPKFCAFDYDNDGLTDLLIAGMYGDDAYTRLAHNIGNGAFQWVEANSVGLPVLKTDDNGGKSFYYNMFSAGDFDRDGYVDIATAGWDQTNGCRGNHLYRNNGDGTFTEVLNFPREDGKMLPMSGSINLVDVNNDGWLDVVTDGYADLAEDGHNNGSQCRIYINNEGKGWTDVTPADFSMPRSGIARVADFNNDGYMDLMANGYTDNHPNCWDTRLYLNNGTESVYDANYIAASGFAAGDRYIFHVRDFDGDGQLDILMDSRDEDFVYYGDTEDGSHFERAPEQHGARGGESIEKSAMGIGDLTNNGLADVFKTGYHWRNGEVKAAIGSEDDWGFVAVAFLNMGSGNGIKPLYDDVDPGMMVSEAPSYVRAYCYNGELSVYWKDCSLPQCGYNVMIITPDGKQISNIPADFETGHVRISDGRQVCVRPGVHSYSISVDPSLPAEGFKVGVQRVDLATEGYSEFVQPEGGVSAVKLIEVEETAAPAVYYNLQGVRVNNPVNGVFVKVENGKAVKVVK